MRAALLSLSLRFAFPCKKKLLTNDCFFFSPLWLSALSVCRWRMRRRQSAWNRSRRISITDLYTYKLFNCLCP